MSPNESIKSKMFNLKLDDLVNRSLGELDELFLLAETPTIDEIDGVTEGRVLAGNLGLNFQKLRQIVNLGLLPWKGKVFSPLNNDEGNGKNRLEVSFFKTKLFHFETNIIDPLVGDNKVFSLNYDLPGNPWIIRQIRDDLKKLRDGLFLGTANFRWKDEYKFVLYFALELP
jgi:hypothetical protein